MPIRADQARQNFLRRGRINNNETRDLLRSYYNDSEKYKPLTREEEQGLAYLAFNNQNQEAKNILILSNLRLVSDMAFKYFHQVPDIRDLIQEGNNGLVYAATKFDPNKGVRFFSYALYWVRAYILRSLMENKSIVKIGTNQLTRNLYHGLIREKNRLEKNKYDGNMSKALAEIFNCSETQIDEMLAWLIAPDTSLDSVVHSGIDTPDTELDFLEDPLDVEDSVIKQEEMQDFRKKIQAFKKTLNERDREIFDNAYLSEEPVSLQEIGNRFDISKQRVNQLEKVMMKDFKAYVLTGSLRVRKVNSKKR